MEKLFSYLARSSTIVVFILLFATLISLYWSARPAIEEFGSYFMFDTRWGVEVPIAGSTAENKDTTATPAQTQADIDIDDEAMEADDDISMDDEDDDIPMDNEDEDIPLDDEEQSSAKTKEIYGGAVPIVGTIFSTIIAMFFAIPLAMGIAVFLSEIASPRLAAPVGIAVELLAVIPSIIYGMWGLFYFGPLIASVFGGNSVSLLVAGLVLGVMVIPFMAALSRDAINTTPDILKESAYAMGATKTEVIKDIIFPYAKAGIIGSIIVSFGRALGETMAVAFVIGGIYEFAGSLTAPTNSITVALANNFSESSGVSMAALFYLALVLFILSFVVIFVAKHYLLRRSKF